MSVEVRPATIHDRAPLGELLARVENLTATSSALKFSTRASSSPSGARS